MIKDRGLGKKMYRVPQGLIDFINKYSVIAIAGHKEPDGDCIGSALSLSLFLNRLNKKTILLSAGPFKRSEISSYAPLFIKELPFEYKNRDDVGAIVVDCSDIERTGSIKDEIENLPLAIIDHHATNTNASSFSFIEPSSPAAACLVQDLIETMSGTLTKDEASFILFAISTDTGFFRHLDEKSEQTFLRVSRLVARGASPKLIFAQINGGKSLSSRILIGRSLERISLYYEGRLAITYQTYEDFLEYGLDGRDSDSLYMLLQAIKGVKAIVVIKEEEGGCSIGFRSFDSIDVSVIAKEFSGGGHKQASGAYCENTSYKHLIPRIVESFKSQMEKYI